MVGGGCLFEAGCLLTFPTYRVSAYSRLGTSSNKYGKLQWCGPLGSCADFTFTLRYSVVLKATN